MIKNRTLTTITSTYTVLSNIFACDYFAFIYLWIILVFAKLNKQRWIKGWSVAKNRTSKNSLILDATTCALIAEL